MSKGFKRKILLFLSFIKKRVIWYCILTEKASGALRPPMLLYLFQRLTILIMSYQTPEYQQVSKYHSLIQHAQNRYLKNNK